MKYHATTLCRIAIATTMVAFSDAQVESSEPIELTRLREQFSNRIDQEMKPWRERYAQELQKLEDRLVKERKLSEALAVKKEKENYLSTDLNQKPDKTEVPSTAEQAKDEMIGSVWLVYQEDDKKRENLIDVYYFKSEKFVYFNSLKKDLLWEVKSKNELLIKLPDLELDVNLSFAKEEGDWIYSAKKYVMILVGKPKIK